MVLFDANFLIFFLDPRIKNGVKNNPQIDYLVELIQKSSQRIVVPTPALAELLVLSGDAGPTYLEILSRSKFLRIEPFGELAAIEAAAIEREVRSKGPKR
jgi:hypothetical protein